MNSLLLLLVCFHSLHTALAAATGDGVYDWGDWTYQKCKKLSKGDTKQCGILQEAIEESIEENLLTLSNAVEVPISDIMRRSRRDELFLARGEQLMLDLIDYVLRKPRKADDIASRANLHVGGWLLKVAAGDKSSPSTQMPLDDD